MTLKSSNQKILVVDDDPAIRQLISRFFSYNNYQIETAEDAKTARSLMPRFNPDLVILDVNLPDDSGFNLCREMRQQGTLVLMLTCLSDTNYILEGFERGADDYITKPFDIKILKAKIGALFNRHHGMKYHGRVQLKKLTFDQLVIDSDRCEVTLNNQPIALTNLEFDLLYFLATNPNRVWERSQLLEAVWGPDDPQKIERKVDVHIGQIRRKIGDFEGELIKTIRGKGYLFEFSETLQEV
ncbi:MAG: response regulator transcription factor [Microcystaceae cyanobacterium]